MNIEIVQWNDFFREVTVAESTATDLTWLWIILLALGGIGFIVAGLGLSGRLPNRQPKILSPPASSSKQQFPTPPSANNKYCPQCGTANPQEAGFCIKCGAQFPSQ